MNASWIINGPQQTNSEARFFAGASLVYQTASFSGALMINHHSGKEDAYQTNNSSTQNQVEAVRNIASRSFLDANIRWYLPYDFEVYLRLNNMTDQKYNGVSLRAENAQGVPSRGASLLTGVRWEF